jgi:hypothetical protein
MDESELLRMRPLHPVNEGIVQGEQAIVPFHANPTNSVGISATLHLWPAGLSSSETTGIGCKRTRGAQEDSDLVNEEEEIDSRAPPILAHEGHGWTRR